MIDAGDVKERNVGFMKGFRLWLDSHPGVEIQTILITHSHWDHFGGVAEVLEELGQRG